MKTQQNFGLIFILLVIGQMMISNFSDFGPYILLTILPALIMCIPTSVSTTVCMIIAFFCGISVDWLADGLLGLNAAALLPVALLKKRIIRIFLGEDILARNDSFSITKNGFAKISFVAIVSNIIFLAIYIFLDSAGTMPLGFYFIRLAASLGFNWLLSLLIIYIITKEDRN